MITRNTKTSDVVGHQVSADFRNPPKEVRKFCRDKERAGLATEARSLLILSHETMQKQDS